MYIPAKLSQLAAMAVDCGTTQHMLTKRRPAEAYGQLIGAHPMTDLGWSLSAAKGKRFLAPLAQIRHTSTLVTGSSSLRLFGRCD